MLDHRNLRRRMIAMGFKKSSPYAGKDFFAWRLGAINLIVVNDPDVFERWRVATKVARALCLDNKADRIRVFDIIVEQAHG